MPSRAKIPTAACGGNREGFLAQRSARREARSRAEADAGHRKRALLPLPEQRAYELAVLAQRSARREARTKGRSGCRAPQEGAASAARTESVRACCFGAAVCKTQGPHQGPKRMQGTARGRCFRCPNRERASLLFWRSGLAEHRKRTYREGVTYHERPYQVSGRYPRVLCLL